MGVRQAHIPWGSALAFDKRWKVKRCADSGYRQCKSYTVILNQWPVFLCLFGYFWANFSVTFWWILREFELIWRLSWKNMRAQLFHHIVTAWWACYWLLLRRGQDCAKHLTVHGSVGQPLPHPQKRIIWPQMSIVLMLRNWDLDIWKLGWVWEIGNSHWQRLRIWTDRNGHLSWEEVC